MKKDLNLLPKEITSKRSGANNESISAVLIIAGIIGLAYFIGYPMYVKYTLEKQKEDLFYRYSNTVDVAIRTAIEKYDVTVQEIVRDKELEGIVNKSEMGYKEVLNAIEQSIPVRVQIESITIDEKNTSINVSAVGADDWALTDFWANLRATKVFDEVIPKAITEAVEQEQDGMEVTTKRCDIELKYVQKG